MTTIQLSRLAAGLLVAGAAMTVLALVAGQRSLALTPEAVRSVLGAFATVWLWATTPRLMFDEAAE